MPLPSVTIDSVVGQPTGKLTGRGSAGTGALEAITLGTNLSLTGTTLNAASPSGAALTKTDDTNVTLTLGGSPTTALLAASSLTLGWTSTLAVARGGIGVGTLAVNGVLYGNTTSAVQALAVNSTATNKFLTQSSSNAPAWAAIVAGDISALAVTWSAAHAWSANGALSAPTLSVTGSAITGGSATTTKPLFLIEPTGTSSTAWQTTGTYLGINGVAGFAGNLIDAQIAHVSQFAVNSNAGVYSTAVCGKMDGSAQYIALGVANELEFWPATAYRVRMTDTTHALGASMIHGWSSNDNPRSANLDSGFSRLGAASVALGNGSAGDFTGSLKFTTAVQIGKTTTYNNVATAGWGLPAIYGSGRSTAQTGAVASVATYTVGAADGSFLIMSNVNVTTSTAHSFTVTCAYTDETNTARTLTLSFIQIGGGTPIATITNVTGAGPYEGVPNHIRCKASTAITIATTGTFTTVTYNVEGVISQIA